MNSTPCLNERGFKAEGRSKLGLEFVGKGSKLPISLGTSGFSTRTRLESIKNFSSVRGGVPFCHRSCVIARRRRRVCSGCEDSRGADLTGSILERVDGGPVVLVRNTLTMPRERV